MCAVIQRVDHAGVRINHQELSSINEYFVDRAKEKVNQLATGKFQEMMKIELINNGPVTILLDSRKNF